MKRKEFLKEVKGMSAEVLTAKACELAEEAMKQRFKISSKTAEKGHLLRKARRDLARVLTQASVLRNSAV